VRGALLGVSDQAAKSQENRSCGTVTRFSAGRTTTFVIPTELAKQAKITSATAATFILSEADGRSVSLCFPNIVTLNRTDLSAELGYGKQRARDVDGEAMPARLPGL